MSALETSRNYNLAQTETGHCLRTLHGSPVQRSSFGIGKVVGRTIYFHKNYYKRILTNEWQKIYEEVGSQVPFQFNCVRYVRHRNELAFIECPNFDTAREPEVGRIFLYENGNLKLESKVFVQIYHHKWLFVDNDYTGFDVRRSWEWSKQWLSVLPLAANGASLRGWNKQLRQFNLPCITE